MARKSKAGSLRQAGHRDKAQGNKMRWWWVGRHGGGGIRGRSIAWERAKLDQ
jgi:hypothetical protein